MEIPKILNTIAATGEVKKALDGKYKERMKIFTYMGMEVFELYKQQKIVIPGMEMHFQKMQQIEKEIADLEKQKQKMEQDKKGIVCICGKTVKRDMLFCPKCGKSVLELQGKAAPAQTGAASQGSGVAAPQQQYRECICGAQVLAGQKMCMECGRIIGN